MKTWLIYPPFADPTQPYLSLPYLKGCLESQGLHATVVDLNVAAAHHLLDPARVERWATKISARFSRLDAHKTFTRLESLEYLALAEARPAALRWLNADIHPVDIFKDPERFYDFQKYRQARDLAEDALICASAAVFPYRFYFNQAAHLALPWGIDLLENYSRQHQSPLDEYYRDFIADSAMRSGDVVGINLTFISQLPEVFYLIHLLRQKFTSLFIVLGGSCLQQILAHCEEKAKRWILRAVDAVCCFEGEQTLPLLLKTLESQWPSWSPSDKFNRLKSIPNLLLPGPGGELYQSPVLRTELNSLAPPDYSDLDLNRYLAPSPMLLFAPTRGCYWNRCTFCDYGLNRSQCHSYREMAADEAARQLHYLSQRHGVRNFYLSVDVMAPRYTEALASALLERKTDIQWSADFRIEKYYTAQRCDLLYRSGLRAAAFGVESGSNRMLKRMDKGITAERIRAVNRCFHQAGVATAWMAFTHHPGEDPWDASQTIRLLQRERPAVDLFILGRFGLTSGSDVAARPEKYGLGRIYFCKGDDFRLFPLYEDRHAPSPQGEQRLEDEVARLSAKYCLDHYPWAGAISTHHSFLYFLKFGPDVFKQLRVTPPKGPVRGNRSLSREWSGLWRRPRHSLALLRAQQTQFMDRFWQAALSAGSSGTAPLDGSFFDQFFGSSV